MKRKSIDFNYQIKELSNGKTHKHVDSSSGFFPYSEKTHIIKKFV